MNYTEVIKNFFLKNKKIPNASIVIFREDGIPLFSTDEHDDSIAALMAGAYQASSTLTQILDGEDSDFRLSFDSSNKGLHIVQLNYLERELLLGCLYKDVTNPGSLKNKIRNLAGNLSKYILEYEHRLMRGRVEKVGPNNSKLNRREQQNNHLMQGRNARKSYLFNDISDDEIDSLFSTLG